MRSCHLLKNIVVSFLEICTETLPLAYLYMLDKKLKASEPKTHVSGSYLVEATDSMHELREVEQPINSQI